MTAPLDPIGRDVPAGSRWVERWGGLAVTVVQVNHVRGGFEVVFRYDLDRAATAPRAMSRSKFMRRHVRAKAP